MLILALSTNLQRYQYDSSSSQLAHDAGIVNVNATTDVPNNFLICQRSGFKIRISEGLKREFDGTLVRAEDYDSRQPQDFVRAVPEHHAGSPSPEQPDRDVATDYPNGVSQSDL